MDDEDSNSSKAQSNCALEDVSQQSSKALLIPTRSYSTSPSNNKYKSRIESLLSSTNDSIPSDTKTDKSPGQKKSVEMAPKVSNTSLLNASAQVLSTANDDMLLPNSRILSGKEISTSLVNLMGTASDSVPINNTTQMPTHPATGFLGSSSNIGRSGTMESPATQRTVDTGNNHTGGVSPNSHTKLTNQYTWCYESSATIHINSAISFDECLPCLEIDDKPLIYREQFQSIEHFNWYGISDTHGPVIISFKYSNDSNKQRFIMAIVRTRQQTSIESLLDISSTCSSIDILRRICDQCAITDIEYFDPVLCDGTHTLLIKYDESYVSNRHKFGIIYQRENQLTEEEIFSNEMHSTAMDKFLDFIGSRVKLKDFQGFRGGLDIKSDQTGTESIYEKFNNHEIMFHVSTLLPHSKIERQQVERKRHIGNDIVAIVFQENETKFNPECIASQFLHVYLVVTPLNDDGTHFKVSVIRRDNVPSFGPVINHSNSFHCDHTFKQWLLTKLINAEIASCKTNTFQKYQERTKMHLFENLYRTLHDSNRPLMSFIFNRSLYKHECEIEQQKEDAQIYSSSKTYDRHADNSILGSVRRRLIAPKFRAQHSITPPPSATIIISTPTSTDSKTKTSIMTMDLKHSASKESITNNSNNGKKSSMFFLSKNHIPPMDKSNTNRLLLDAENVELSVSPRSNSKFLSPATSPLTPSNYFDYNEESYSFGTSFYFNKLSMNHIDSNTHNELSPDHLHSSSKDDLIKFVIALQQQHSTKLAQMDEIHSKALKELEIQLTQPRSMIDGDTSSN
ncbi:unnamed protein product [Rotaria magnacalcarata]|nr:unnamed protein product [Rotaria magnacalcarata]CAF2132376.1 unnamed protein product [Rotaria magnacalcarata]